MKNNRIIHFEIHAADTAKIAEFYKTVFGWEIKKWDPPMPKASEGQVTPAVDYWMDILKKLNKPAVLLLCQKWPYPGLLGWPMVKILKVIYSAFMRMTKMRNKALCVLCYTFKVF